MLHVARAEFGQGSEDDVSAARVGFLKSRRDSRDNLIDGRTVGIANGKLFQDGRGPPVKADNDGHCFPLLWTALNAGECFRPDEFLRHVGDLDGRPVHIWINPIAWRLICRKTGDPLNF